MNKTLFSLCLVLGAAAGNTLHAATVCKTYAEAAPTVKDDGYIAFVYGPDWDKRSTAICKKLINDPAVQAAAGDAVLILAPLYQDPTDKQKTQQEGIWGSLPQPHPHSAHTYPALHFYDKNGRLAGFVRGHVMVKGDPAEVAAEVKQRMGELRQQYALLEQAEKAQGVEKAKLIGQACRIPNTERPDKVVDTLKALDPKDESGFVRSISMGDSAFGEANKDLPLEEGLKKMDELLKDDAYTNAQKQVFCTVAIGLLHRQGTKADNERILKYAAKIKELVPDNYLAKSADIAANRWMKGLTLEGGWSPDAFPTPPGTPAELLGSLPIKKPGTYKVSFQFGSGRDALLIKKVELFDGTRSIAKDEHEGFAGRKPDKNEYSLRVPTAPKDPHLFITFGNAAGATDSAGSISIGKEK